MQLPTRITLQLTEIARVQGREIPDILQDAIAEYVERHTNEREFREAVRAAMQRHQWLLKELADK